MAPRVLTPILGFVLVVLGLNVGRLLVHKFNGPSDSVEQLDREPRAATDYFSEGNVKELPK